MNDDIISVNNYDSSSDEFKSLPYIGWIKPCFYNDCRTISSHFTIITYKKTKFKVYLASLLFRSCFRQLNEPFHASYEFLRLSFQCEISSFL